MGNRGVEYMFRVRAMNDVGTGEPSESSKPALAVDPIEPPGEPLGFKVSDSNKSSISLSFKAPAYDGGTNIMGYIIEHTEALPPPPKVEPKKEEEAEKPAEEENAEEEKKVEPEPELEQ